MVSNFPKFYRDSRQNMAMSAKFRNFFLNFRKIFQFFENISKILEVFTKTDKVSLTSNFLLEIPQHPAFSNNLGIFLNCADVFQYFGNILNIRATRSFFCQNIDKRYSEPDKKLPNGSAIVPWQNLDPWYIPLSQ